MVYTRNKIEMAVLGTLMGGSDNYESCRISLRQEIFSDKRNRFIFGLIEKMYADGIREFYPYDIFKYAEEREIRYGDMVRFCAYMCRLCDNYAVEDFIKYVRELVKMYLQEIRYGKK